MYKYYVQLHLCCHMRKFLSKKLIKTSDKRIYFHISYVTKNVKLFPNMTIHFKKIKHRISYCYRTNFTSRNKAA